MLFDTFAWVEFFKGSEFGKKVAKIMLKEKCFTSVISLGELVEWCLKNNLEDKIEEYLKGIEKASIILEVKKEIVLLAGKINNERKKKIKDWGMVDSIILATAIFAGVKILTRDIHFKDLENVEFLR
ncbi:MAG: PIN domain-containing protein [Candidatus Aenigmatarchaeota archaeon]